MKFKIVNPEHKFVGEVGEPVSFTIEISEGLRVVVYPPEVSPGFTPIELRWILKYISEVVIIDGKALSDMSAQEYLDAVSDQLIDDELIAPQKEVTSDEYEG